MQRKLSYEQIKSVDGFSSREAARIINARYGLNIGKTTINDSRKALHDGTFFEETRAPRILTLDIESRPITAYVWGLWDQNVGINQIKEQGGMMCFAAKWLGDDDILFYSEYADGYEGMVKKCWELLSECDILVTYNGDRYDDKRMNNEFLKLKLGPPKPYKTIDLIKTNKNRFDLPSRKLDFLAQYVGVGAKVKHQGFDLWVDCMAGDPEAWELMEKYNRGDVVVTEGSYLEILPWLTNAPHLGMYTADSECCWACGSTKLTPSGQAHTLVQSYDLFQCQNCKAWNRGTTRLQNSIKTRAIR